MKRTRSSRRQPTFRGRRWLGDRLCASRSTTATGVSKDEAGEAREELQSYKVQWRRGVEVEEREGGETSRKGTARVGGCGRP